MHTIIYCLNENFRLICRIYFNVTARRAMFAETPNQDRPLFIILYPVILESFELKITFV